MRPHGKLSSESDHKILWYGNKIGKNFREFQIKNWAYHYILWYAFLNRDYLMNYTVGGV